MYKRIVLILLLGLTLSSCDYQDHRGQINSSINLKNLGGHELSEPEKNIVQSLGMNENLAMVLKSYSYPQNLQQLSQSDSGWPAPNYSGISISLPEEKAEKLLKKYSSFRDNGFLLFRSERNFSFEPDEISVIKSIDQYDILRYSGTDGVNYDLYPDDIINKLKEWERIYPFQIVGADLDWVEARFQNKEMDFSKLAKEVYDFCPDVVDQGTGTVEELEKEMKQDGVLYLWWD